MVYEGPIRALQEKLLKYDLRNKTPSYYSKKKTIHLDNNEISYIQEALRLLYHQ